MLFSPSKVEIEDSKMKFIDMACDQLTSKHKKIGKRESVDLSEHDKSTGKHEYDIAPDMDEIDKMSVDACQPRRRRSLRDPVVLKRIEDYRLNAIKNSKTRLEQIIAANSLRECKDYDYFILLPDEYCVLIWNSFIVIMYIISFTVIPLSLAFFDKHDWVWKSADLTLDFIFLIEIILTFFKAFYDENFILIDKPKLIACSYMKSWFIFDILS